MTFQLSLAVNVEQHISYLCRPKKVDSLERKVDFSLTRTSCSNKLPFAVELSNYKNNWL